MKATLKRTFTENFCFQFFTSDSFNLNHRINSHGQREDCHLLWIGQVLLRFPSYLSANLCNCSTADQTSPSFWDGPVSANYFYNFYKENSQKFFPVSKSPLILTSITTDYKFKEPQQYILYTARWKPLSTDRKGAFLHQNSLQILRNIFIVKSYTLDSIYCLFFNLKSYLTLRDIYCILYRSRFMKQIVPCPYNLSVYRARICKPYKELIPSLADWYDNPIWRTCPKGYIDWRNRFLGIDSWAP